MGENSYSKSKFLSNLKFDALPSKPALGGFYAPTIESEKATHIYKLKTWFIVSFAVITIVLTMLSSHLIYSQSNNILTEKVSSLTSELTVQMRLNMENYLEKFHTTSTLIFSNEDAYTYSATDTILDEYDALNKEEEISNFLYDISIIDNYVDFAIVYENNHAIGRISNGTKALFGDTIYEILASNISDDEKLDGWLTGYNGNYKRIYYIKKLNNSAVFVASFYSNELCHVFKYPDGFGNITIRLVNENNIVLYSTDSDEMGKVLPEEILSRTEGLIDSSIIDFSYLVSTNSCANNWSVICSIPTKDILKEKTQLLLYVSLIVIIFSSITLVIFLLLATIITNPIRKLMRDLRDKADMDELTGLLCRSSFIEFCSSTLAHTTPSEIYALILVDFDNFREFNDKYGPAEGDKALTKLSAILVDNYNENSFIGRIGGDEFSILFKLPFTSAEIQETIISNKCEALIQAVNEASFGPQEDSKLTVSIGASIYGEHGFSFHDIVDFADKALKIAKTNEKNTYKIYGRD